MNHLAELTRLATALAAFQGLQDPGRGPILKAGMVVSQVREAREAWLVQRREWAEARALRKAIELAIQAWRGEGFRV